MKNFRPTKAVLLAAGFGTRLLPLTRELPKPLLPLWGRSLLDRALDTLAGFGVREVLINLHQGADAIRAQLERHPRTDLHVQLSFEPVLLGTGGALVRAAWFLPEAEPFWMLNADVAADLDPKPLLADFARHHPLATLWLVPKFGPQTVEMRKGRVVNLTSPRAGQPDLFTFAGLHLLSKRILDFLPRQEVFASMTPTYTAAMSRGAVVRGVAPAHVFWSDLGTPAQYLATHAAVRLAHRQRQRGGRLFGPIVARRAWRSGFQVNGFVALGDDVRIGQGARLANCVVLSGARIAPRVQLNAAVVGGATDVRRDASGLVGRADRWLDAVEQQALRRAGFAVERTMVNALGVRASQRTFARLLDGAQSAVLIRYDPAREENQLYARHARFLRRIGVPAPEVLLDWPRHRLCLTNDLGQQDLLTASHPLPRNALIALYERVLQVVLALHTRGTMAARRVGLQRMPDFDSELYHWEREYFAEHMLRRRCGLPLPAIRRITRELAQVAGHLERAPQVLVHRDLQSSNVLMHRGVPHLIDFQGMRMGAAAYDLASLLCDPYSDLPAGVQQHLVEFYACHGGGADVTAVFWWAAVQRLAQALGAFSRLSTQPDMAYFADHIPATLRQMRRALEHLPGFPALRAWVESNLLVGRPSTEGCSGRLGEPSLPNNKTVGRV